MTAASLPDWAPNPAEVARRLAEYERRRYQRKRAGDWAPFTDTTPVRHHLQALREAGVTQEQIGAAAAVSVATLTRAGKETRMTSAAAAALMAIPVPNVGRKEPPGAAAAATGEKLQTLVADGWTLVQIAQVTGLSEHAVYQQIHQQVPPMRSTTEAIDRAYDQLVNNDPGDGYLAARARLRAERAGWQPSTPPPPPEADIDEVAVDRVVAGDRLPLRPAEQLSVLARLAGSYPDDEIARRLGLSTRTVLRHRSQNQLPAYTGHLRQPDTPGR
jgi:DNA-binding CsgD family transcriptional regulator